LQAKPAIIILSEAKDHKASSATSAMKASGSRKTWKLPRNQIREQPAPKGRMNVTKGGAKRKPGIANI